MKRNGLWWLDLQIRDHSGEVTWDNEPTLVWPNWTPPHNTYTVPGPRPKPQPEIGGVLGKGINPLNIGTGLPLDLETPRVRLSRPWLAKSMPSIRLVGGRDLLLVSEAVWHVLSTLAPNDIEGVRADFVDANDKPCPPHWVIDLVTFRNLKEERAGKWRSKSPDSTHQDLGAVKVFRKQDAPGSRCMVDDLAQELKALPLNITRVDRVGEFIDV